MKSRDYIGILIIVFVSMTYFYLCPAKFLLLDIPQDFSFVLGQSFDELFSIQYNYLSGLVPLLVAWTGTKIFSTLQAFSILQFILSAIYAAIMAGFLVNFIKTRYLIRLLISIILIFLLLNPGQPLWGWKLPYTIAACMGTVFTLLFFYFSLNLLRSRSIYHYFCMIMFGMLAIFTKLEFTVVIIGYFFFLAFFLLYRNQQSLSTKTKICLIIAAILFLSSCFISWHKFLPQVSGIPHDGLLLKYLSLSTVSLSSNEIIVSDRLKLILGISNFAHFRWIDIFLQITFFILMSFLHTHPTLSRQRKMVYEWTITFLYILYLTALLIIKPDAIFLNLAIITFFISIWHHRKIIRDPPLLCLFVLAFLYVLRVFANIGFGVRYSTFFIFPLFLLFIAIINRFYKTRILLIVLALMGTVLLLRTNTFFQSDHHIVKCSNGHEYAVGKNIKLLIDEFEKLMPHRRFKTLASAKFIPFLNACFNIPNPVKKFSSFQKFAFASDAALKSYIQTVRKTNPDAFVFLEPLNLFLLTKTGHYEFSLPEAHILLDRFRNELEKTYESVVIIPAKSRTNDLKPLNWYIYYH